MSLNGVELGEARVRGNRYEEFVFPVRVFSFTEEIINSWKHGALRVLHPNVCRWAAGLKSELKRERSCLLSGSKVVNRTMISS